MTGDATRRERAARDTPGRDTLRTFVAIDLSSPILQRLAETQDELQRFLAGQRLDRVVRWSPVKNLHLTLRFLGDTTTRQREDVTARLQNVASATQPFTLSVDVSGRGLGAFPNLRQPRVLWSGVGGDLKALGQLQAAVEEVAQAAGFAAEEKGFSPHLTLARAARDADRRKMAQLGRAIGNYASAATMSESLVPELLNFEVDRLIFYQSELGAGGSRYTALAELPFGGS